MLAETWEVVIWLLLVGQARVPRLLLAILHLVVGMSKRVLKKWDRKRMNQMLSLAERDQMSRGGKRDRQHWGNKGHGG